MLEGSGDNEESGDEESGDEDSGDGSNDDIELTVDEGIIKPVKQKGRPGPKASAASRDAQTKLQAIDEDSDELESGSDDESGESVYRIRFYAGC